MGKGRECPGGWSYRPFDAYALTRTLIPKSHAIGGERSRWQLVKKNARCESGVSMGTKRTIERCRKAVAEAGGEFFTYGTGLRKWMCRMELPDCAELITDPKYNIYKTMWGDDNRSAFTDSSVMLYGVTAKDDDAELAHDGGSTVFPGVAVLALLGSIGVCAAAWSVAMRSSSKARCHRAQNSNDRDQSTDPGRLEEAMEMVSGENDPLLPL